jgi:hypothetical protein
MIDVEFPEIGEVVDEMHDCGIVDGSITELQRREGVLESQRGTGEIPSVGRGIAQGDVLDAIK